MSASADTNPRFLHTRLRRISMVVVGLLVAQFLLYGQSIRGQKILLPLDILTVSGMWVPQPASGRHPPPHNMVRSDYVFHTVPLLTFATNEIRHGRLPSWDPLNYTGTPLASYPILSPFYVPFYFYDDPIMHAWVQVGRALLAGVGMYLFLRRATSLGFWPAAFGAWCYPLTGYFMQWQGYPPSGVAAFFPWMMLGTELAFRRSTGGLLLALSGAGAIYSGQADVAALALIGTGLYATCRVLTPSVRHAVDVRLGRAVCTLLLGWGLAIALSAPYLIPLADYTKSSARLAERAKGGEDRPPFGLRALPVVVLPNSTGTNRWNSLYIDAVNTIEGPPAAYAGLLVTLLLAPLAFTARGHRAQVVACVVLVCFGLCWTLNFGPMVWLMRLPFANMLSYNRALFVSTFALVTLASIGAEVFARGETRWRAWFVLPAALTVCVLFLCVYRLFHLPEPIATQLGPLLSRGLASPTVDVAGRVRLIQADYRFYFGLSGVLAAVTCAGWVGILVRKTASLRVVAIVGFVAIVDLLAYGWDVNVQCDRSLYYPPIPALTALANAPTPGRVLGVNCLPPNLNLMAGLSDVRGYDGVDPKLIVQVMNRARLRGTDVLNYAQLQWFAPDIDFSPNSLSPVPPILKMLNVRYFIMRGSNTNSINTIFSSADYLVIENPNTLPRAYVPRRVEVVAGPDARLDRLADRRFDPRWLALVNEPVDLPDTDIVGAVKITSEVPTRVTLDAQMQTAGLVVLADQWDKGWSATVDGRPAPIVHANHAIRGVVLPPGSHTIVMSYFPTSLKVGIAVGITGLAGLLAWMALLMFGAAGRKPSVVAG